MRTVHPSFREFLSLLALLLTTTALPAQAGAIWSPVLRSTDGPVHEAAFALERAGLEAALSLVGLFNRSSHYPSQLSGGQAQRVGIARAIVADPTFLLCDEPTGDLDRRSADEVMDLISSLAREQGKTVLLVTHDPMAAEMADVVLHLEKGVLVEASRVGEEA